VNGSLCAEDIKRAISGWNMERVGERELLCGETTAGCKVMEEGVALCDMWVFLQTHFVFTGLFYTRGPFPLAP
jgi:cytidine deaminase